MTAGVVLAAVLALAAVVIVAWPFLREPEVPVAEDLLPGASPAERERLRLAEERDQALAALSELEFDHRTGKVSDDDYATLVGPLRARAAATLRALDDARGAPPVSESRAAEPDPPPAAGAARMPQATVEVETSRPTG